MSRFQFLILCSVSFFQCSSPQKMTNSNGEVVFDEVGGRELQIYLPPGYDKSNSYPVAYFHDGQNLFDTATAYLAEWRLDEIMDSLIALDKIEPVVIVGIYNSPQRAEEYTPYNDEGLMEMMGMETWNGALHIMFEDFIVYDVFKYVEENYNVSSSREDRAIFGSSLGGLNALWLGMDNADKISFIGALSPSVWVRRGAVVIDIKTYDSLPNVKTWIDQGSKEWNPICIELTSVLMDKGLTYGEDLWYYEHNNATHNEIAWSQRVAYPLMLFKGKNPDPTFSELKGELMLAYNEFDEEKTVIPRVNAILSRKDGIQYSLLDRAGYFSDDWEIDSVGNLIQMPADNTTIGIEFQNRKIEWNQDKNSILSAIDKITVD